VRSASSGRTSSKVLVPSLNGYAIEPSITRPEERILNINVITVKRENEIRETYSHRHIDFSRTHFVQSHVTQSLLDWARHPRIFAHELSSTAEDPLLRRKNEKEFKMQSFVISPGSKTSCLLYSSDISSGSIPAKSAPLFLRIVSKSSTFFFDNLLMLVCHDVDPVPVDTQRPELLVFVIV
jgi:hypothetical protein